MGAWKPREEGSVSSSCLWIRCRTGGDGGNLIVPFIILIVISGLVLPFVWRGTERVELRWAGGFTNPGEGVS